MQLAAGTPERCEEPQAFYVIQMQVSEQDVEGAVLLELGAQLLDSSAGVEDEATAVARQDLDAGKSIFVAGDFNTPLQEVCKTGEKLSEDAEPLMGCTTKLEASACRGKDGFDDTYAVLTKGLVADMRFRVLTEGIGRTYAKGDFVDSPIDNVLVVGPLSSGSFSAMKIKGPENDSTFGSDHYPVVVRRAP